MNRASCPGWSPVPSIQFRFQLGERTEQAVFGLTPLVTGHKILSLFKGGVPGMRRIDDVANAALLLCSDAASYINSVTLVVDGGQWLASNPWIEA